MFVELLESMSKLNVLKKEESFSNCLVRRNIIMVVGFVFIEWINNVRRRRWRLRGGTILFSKHEKERFGYYYYECR